ncbi:MAG TPA: isochorismatase family protein [Hyphomicrobiaceae bacterium]|nr:isochorismatase family protein [Hyphomicrobiaceae bacterium]
MKEWMKLIPRSELALYEKIGFADGASLGARPALIVVDVTYGFTGSEGLTLDEAIAEFQPACGPVSWETMPRIAALIGLFRDRRLPVVFTRSDLKDVPFTGKSTRSKRGVPRNAARFSEFPAAIAPRDGEWVLEKTKASAFFQTPLLAYLVRQGIDTVVVCGVSTSGCVRATAVDAASHGFNTLVVDDCCFDRSAFAHATNLFDLTKYAAVVSLSELGALLAESGAAEQRA